MDPSKQVHSLVPERILLAVMILAVFVIIVGGNYALNPSSLIPGLSTSLVQRNIVTGAAANAGIGLGTAGYWMVGIGVIALFWVIFLLVYFVKKRKAVEPMEEVTLPAETALPSRPAVQQPSPEMAKVDEALSMLEKGIPPKELTLSTFKPLPKPRVTVKKKREAQKTTPKPVKGIQRKVVKKKVAAPVKKMRVASKPRRIQDDLARVDQAIAKAEQELRR